MRALSRYDVGDRAAFKARLVEQANAAMPRIAREGMPAVEALVRDNNLVFGVWQDTDMPGGVGTLIIKGEPSLKIMASMEGSSGPSFSIDMKCASIPCTCAEQAHALREVHGDGAGPGGAL